MRLGLSCFLPKYNRLFDLTCLFVGSLLLAVAIYYSAYSDPSLYNSDWLMLEHMYRDLIVQGGELAKWHLPPAAYYLDIGLYFGLRSLVPDVHAGLAAFAAVQVCLLSGAAIYAIRAMPLTAGARLVLSLAEPALLLLLDKGGVPYLKINMIHVMALVTAIVSMGILLRGFDAGLESSRGRAYALALAVITAISTSSDTFHVLWFCMPACVLIAALALMRRIGLREAGIWIGLIGVGVLGGKFLDSMLRPMPNDASMFKPKFKRLVQFIPIFADHFVNVYRSTYVSIAFFTVGFGGLVWGVMRRGTLGQLSTLILLSLLINVVGVTINGQAEHRYFLACYVFPPLVGTLLWFGVVSRLPKQAWIKILLGVITILSLLILLNVTVKSYKNRYSSLYPAATRFIDELIESKNLQTGVAGYWEARYNSILSKTNVHLAPALGHGFLPHQVITTRDMFLDKYDMVVLNPNADSYHRIDADLVKRLNGQPDEVITSPEESGLGDILIYRDGARMASWADLLLDGKRLIPDIAAHDFIIWQGEISAAGITCKEFRTAPRWYDLWGIFIFEEGLDKLKGRHIQLETATDRTPSLRRSIALRLSPATNAPLDRLWRLFLRRRCVVVGDDNSVALPNGGCAVFFKLPERDVKTWDVILLSIDDTMQRIK